MNLKSGLKLVLKIGIAILCLYLVFQKLEWSEIRQTLQSIKPLYFILALFSYILSKIVSSYRLNIFFRIHGLEISESANLKLYWLGMFYNIFLPGGIGGDGYKVYLLNKEFKIGTKPLISAVFVDRLSGMAILLVLAFFLLSFSSVHHLFIWSGLMVLPIILGFYLFVKWLFSAYLTDFSRFLAYSFFVQLAQIICIIFLLLAFEVKADWIEYLVLFLASSVVSVIPVSLGGIGIRELCFLYGSQLFQLNEPTAVTISFCFYLITVLASLLGIYYSLRTPNLK